ncbi:hypothetical protein DL93DRAFT_2081339 [Clavulina sp. PMI_390]|nr:hypothetical protein DL93DRAFT_2081339 [Clavulina sp. PMI_390]
MTAALKSDFLPDKMDRLDNLPLEVLEQIVIHSGTTAAIRLAQSSKHLHTLINRNTAVWRELYLNMWDDPRICNPEITNSTEWSWKEATCTSAEAVKTIHRLKTLQSSRLSGSKTNTDIKSTYIHLQILFLRSSGGPGHHPGDCSSSRTLTRLRDLLGAYCVALWPIMIPRVYLDQETPNIDKRETSEECHPTAKPYTRFDSLLPTSELLDRQPARWQLLQRAGYPTPPISHPLALEGSEGTKRPLMTFAEHSRLASRSFVYDMRNYNEYTVWGPWTPRLSNAGPGDDSTPLTNGGILGVGPANWTHVMHMMNVVRCNIEEYRNPLMPATGRTIAYEDYPFSLSDTCPYTAPGWDDDRSERDWAGVEGEWNRVVCFMDYGDLLLANRNYFNDNNNDDQPIDDDAFFQPDFYEELRVLHTTMAIESIDDPATTPGLVDPSRPTIRFRGTSRHSDGNEHSMRGFVCVTESGDIRWHLISEVGSEDRWQSSGVQVGGVGSAFGIVGAWSPYEHELRRDPAGPFWMWKTERTDPQVRAAEEAERNRRRGAALPILFFLDDSDDEESEDEDYVPDVGIEVSGDGDENEDEEDSGSEVDDEGSNAGAETDS